MCSERLATWLGALSIIVASCSSTSSTDVATTDAPTNEASADVAGDGFDALPEAAADANTDDASDGTSPTDASPMDAMPTDGATPDVGLPDGAARDVTTVDSGPPRDPLAGIGTVETVRTGFMFLEGPHWRTAESALYFSDIPANTIHRLREPADITSFRMPSGNSNGLSSDAMGQLLACEHGTRRLSRTRAGGMVETVVDRFMGLRLNSPNDVVVRGDGTIYFTDPPYGISTAMQELTFNGVFRVSPSGGVTAEWRGSLAARPNGVALSPDDRLLYVSDTATSVVRVHDVQPDGALGPERMFARTSGGPDGMAIDRDGNLFVTTSAGVQVFGPDARVWGTIRVAMQPANCAFGGPDARTLYITARQGLYRVRLANPGRVD